VLPLLPHGTKKRDVMPFLRDWISREANHVDELKGELISVTAKIERLQV
jgi:hypothetical protein